MGSALKINSNVERLDSDRYGIRRIRLRRGREKFHYVVTIASRSPQWSQQSGS